VLDIAANIKPSSRVEVDITDAKHTYLHRDDLYVEVLGGFAWLDGTHSSPVEAVSCKSWNNARGLRVACLEEIALRQRYISLQQLERLAEKTARRVTGDIEIDGPFV
jgi:glucose-1-phosphate thymidylyltransferase